MKEHGINENIRQLLEALRIPAMLCDRQGTVLTENRLWVDMRLSPYAEKLRENIRKVGTEGGEVTFRTEEYSVISRTVTLDGEPFVLTQLIVRAGDAAEINDSYRQRLALSGERNYIATSSQMIHLFTKAKQVAIYPTSIMILGETGVGKEVLSAFIHNNSDRSDKPFIKINCSAIPEPLMESELFGYEGGAFTGARDKGKAGLFELANHGTILLDEIGDMALPMQAKLLRVIQDGEIRRVGGAKAIALDVRIITATSRDLEEMVAEGSFLDALYYRLNVVELRIPPLRQRKEDILPLAEYYLRFFCEKYKLDREFSQETRECFTHYQWPGNVRELRNTVENLVVSVDQETIGDEALPSRLLRREIAAAAAEEIPAPVGETSLKQAVENLQRQMIQAALRQHGSLRKAATALDMDPTTLHRLAKKLNGEN